MQRQNIRTAVAAETDRATLPETLIAPARRWEPLQLAELWEHRELLVFLTWRDIKIRYKQTALGAAWAIIQPFMTMVVFSVFFGRLAGVPSDGLPYPVFTYTALVPWMFFANALTQAGNSLVAQEHIITKVYFPRLLVPAAAVLAGLLDFAISFVVLVGLMFFYGIVPTAAILTIPLFILLAAIASLGFGIWFSALNVEFRDVRYAIPFLVQFWLFATPIAYPSSIVPVAWRVVYGLNPMTGVVEGFRWALLGQAPPPAGLLLASTVVALVVGLGGLFYFKRMEQSFADIV